MPITEHDMAKDGRNKSIAEETITVMIPDVPVSNSTSAAHVVFQVPHPHRRVGFEIIAQAVAGSSAVVDLFEESTTAATVLTGTVTLATGATVYSGTMADKTTRIAANTVYGIRIGTEATTGTVSAGTVTFIYRPLPYDTPNVTA